MRKGFAYSALLDYNETEGAGTASQRLLRMLWIYG